MKNYASKITAVIVMTVFSLLFVFIFGELSDIITAVPVIKNIDYSYPSSEAPDPDGALTNPTPPKLIDVPYIYQDEHYPNGCESVSAVMALKYLGINITVDEFIDLYLDKAEAPTVGGIGEDPRQYYLGDPRSDYGWGCYSPVIATALHKILNSQEYTVSNSYGEPLSQLCRRYIDAGIPVIVWVTIDMQNAEGEEYIAKWTTINGREIAYNKKLHCVLLIGYDKDYYYFNDPKYIGKDTKYVAYSKDKAETAYSLLGMQSIAIYEK